MKKHIGRVIFAIVLGILTYIKLYTVNISLKDEPTSMIVKTETIVFSDNINLNNDNVKSMDWFFHKEYKIIYSDEYNNLFSKFYVIIIKVWWIMLIYIFGSIIYHVIKN